MASIAQEKLCEIYNPVTVHLTGYQTEDVARWSTDLESHTSLNLWWIINYTLREYQIFSAHLTAIKQVWLPRNTRSVSKADGMSVLRVLDDIIV